MHTYPALDRLRHYLNDFQVNRGIEKEAYERDISAVLEHLEDHLFDPNLNVEVLKYRCKLRNNNISSRFKLRIGLGIQQYIERRRMAAAKKLLSVADSNIYYVAVTVGYSHHETFCRAFKRVEGCTPSDYKARLSHLSPAEAA